MMMIEDDLGQFENGIKLSKLFQQFILLSAYLHLNKLNNWFKEHFCVFVDCSPLTVLWGKKRPSQTLLKT